MITPLLRSALEPVVRHRRFVRAIWWSAGACLAIVIIGMAALPWLGVHMPIVLVVIAALIAARLAGRRADQWQPDYPRFARDIEERHPDLHAVFITAVEQQPDPETGGLHFLQQRVVQEAISQAQQRGVLAPPPRSSLHAIAAVLLVTATLWALSTRTQTLKETKTAKRTAAEALTVTPGDVEIERGSGLVVLATFHRDVPGAAELVMQPENQPAQTLALVKNLDDPVFGGGLPEVTAPLTYRIDYAGKSTREFRVTVFEHPRLDRADARVRFPDYTRLPEKHIPDTRRVSAVEGSTLDIAFQLNKPVRTATLVAKDGTAVPLSVEPGRAVAALRDFSLKASASYELRLVDAEGRANKVPAQLTLEALPNRRPELKFLAPRGDQRVSQLEEIGFKGEAWDDFGMSAAGLTYTVAGGAVKDIVLARDTKPDERATLAHLLKLEELGLKPDELLSWSLWAEDIGPDGKPRRTSSDMFFAEVRPFEEIYRPGDGGEGSGQQQQGGAGEEATKLAELQKQIISATWNLQRAENSDGKPSEKYLKDAPVIRDGQADALKQATALAEKAEDPKSRALIDAVTREMQTAHERLVEAAQSPAPLPAALSSEQSAYNALLKLAAHEFQITRSKSSSGKQSASRNQQQLDELEMKDEKKRYETKREAEPQQNEQQREQLAILNRLKELAQRQQDINERLKELQTALQAAKSEPEKEELKRQLKRLREEEQQLLADLDEAKQKMEQSPQQSQLAEERQRLEQTRSEAQKAAESMEKGQPSQALASGTRAQRELQELRDDFRKKTSGQFNEELREMRADARTLAQEQQELAQKLAEPAARERRTLDGSSPREQLAKDFERQQQGLGELREQMRSVSEKAEAAEPLLAKELYDALRKNAQDNTEETLKTAGQLAQRGYGTQAQKFEEKAREEIEEIKTGVERAAESVLGNEAEALRMARAELDALAGQLDREISKARPDLASGEGADAKTPGSTPVPGVGEGVPPSRTSSDAPKSEGAAEGAKPDEVRPGGTPGPTPGTGVLPGTPQPRGEGKSPAQGEGESQQPGQQPGQQQGKQPGQQGQPGQQAGQQPGQQGQPGQQPGQQGGQQPGQPAQGSPQPGKGSGSGAGGDPSGNADPSSTGQQPGSRLSDLARAPRNRDRGGSEGGGSGGGPLDGEQAGPIRGEGYAEWSDRLRNIEEVLDDPALRNEAARIRELARGMRVDFKRHSLEPKWDLVKTTIGAPLAELRNRLTEELARRESKDSLVPIDRDPVPTKYAERVRRYYEDLGRSR